MMKLFVINPTLIDKVKNIVDTGSFFTVFLQEKHRVEPKRDHYMNFR